MFHQRRIHLTSSVPYYSDQTQTNVTLLSLYRIWTTEMSNPKNTNASDQAGDEAPKDPGSLTSRTALLADDDVEGHRVFHGSGFHMPTSAYRRRPKGHRKHHRIANGGQNKNRSKEDDEEFEHQLKNLRPCTLQVCVQLNNYRF